MTTQSLNTPALPIPPWYRQFWPWALMAGPAIVVVAGFITLWLALRTPEALVVDDYYKEGRAIQQSLQRDTAARNLGLSGHLQLDQREVELNVKAQATYAWPEQLELLLSHPVDAKQDQRVLLQRYWQNQESSSGQHAEQNKSGARYRGVAAQLPDNIRYQFILQDRAGQWRLMSLGRGGQHQEVEFVPLTQ